MLSEKVLVQANGFGKGNDKFLEILDEVEGIIIEEIYFPHMQMFPEAFKFE